MLLMIKYHYVSTHMGLNRIAESLETFANTFSWIRVLQCTLCTLYYLPMSHNGVPNGPIHNKAPLAQVMDWQQTCENYYSYRRRPVPQFNIKMTSYQYRKSHCGDKTVVRSSYLHNGISYTGKMSSLYWIRAQVLWRHGASLCYNKSAELLYPYSCDVPLKKPCRWRCTQTISLRLPKLSE